MKKIVLAAFAAATMAAPAFAMSNAACKAEWDKADANRDGVLVGEEARPYLSSMTSAPADGRITPALFLASCEADTFKAADATGKTTGNNTGGTTATGTVVPAPASTSTLPAAPPRTSPSATQTATTDPGAPLPGANSFTEEQAKDRVAKAGFADISAMKKDDQGIWRGTASKSGATVNVAVDYRGNVVSN